MSISRNTLLQNYGKTVAVYIGLGAFTVAFLYFFRALEQSPNGLGYGMQVSTEEANLFYAPHLLHMSIIRFFYVSLSGIAECDAICAGQIHSILWATTAVLGMYAILRHLTASALVALAGAMFLLVSNTFWVFATQLEVYAPVVGSLTLLATLLLLKTDRWPHTRHILACTAVWAVATLYHQANAIFFVPLATYMIAKFGVPAWKRITSISLLAGVFVLVTYAIAYLSVKESIAATSGNAQPFVTWMLALADVPLTNWGSAENWSLFGLHRGLYSQVTSLVVLPDEVRPYQFPVLWRGALAIVAVLIWNMWRTVRRAPAFKERLFFLVWFVTYFVFFVWWDPGVLKFFLPSAVPIVALGALTFHDVMSLTRRIGVRNRYAGRAAKGIVIGLAMLVIAGTFAFTLVGSIMPIRGNSGPALGPHYAEAAILDSIAPRDCFVYGWGHQLVNLQYYFGRRGEMLRTQRNIYEEYYRHVNTKDKAEQARISARLFPDESCALIRLGFIGQKRFAFKTEGYMASPDWRSFLDWFFRAEYSEGRDLVTFDSFRVITHEERAPYVLIDRRIRDEADRDYVVALLADYESSYQGSLTTPQFPGRDRMLIFGYSGNRNTSTSQLSLWSTLMSLVRHDASRTN